MTNELITTNGNQVATLEQYASNLKTKLDMAATLLKGGLIPQHFRTPEAVLTAILYGQEIGLSPMQSVLSVTVIQGKPTLDAAGLKAIILANGGRVETVTWTDKLAKLRGVRGEWKEEVEYTLHDAELAGLAAKDNWRRMPKAMLYARCVSIIARNMFADLIKGFYSKEEMLDSVSAPLQIVEEDTHESNSEPIIEGKTEKPEYRDRGYGIRPTLYKIKEPITREQEIYLQMSGFHLNVETGIWQGPQDLGPRLEQYRVASEDKEKGKTENVALAVAESLPEKKGRGRQPKTDNRSEKWMGKAPKEEARVVDENDSSWIVEANKLMEEDALKLENEK